MKRARTKKKRQQDRARSAANSGVMAYHNKFVQPAFKSLTDRVAMLEQILKRSLLEAIGDAEVVVMPEEEPLELYEPRCPVCNPSDDAEPGTLCARHAGVVTVDNEEAL